MEEKNRFEKLEIDRGIESEEKKRAYLRLISTIKNIEVLKKSEEDLNKGVVKEYKEYIVKFPNFEFPNIDRIESDILPQIKQKLPLLQRHTVKGIGYIVNYIYLIFDLKVLFEERRKSLGRKEKPYEGEEIISNTINFLAKNKVKITSPLTYIEKKLIFTVEGSEILKDCSHCINGKITCPSCKGAKIFRCGECMGNRIILCPSCLGNPQRWERCSLCWGRGYTSRRDICLRCNGRGYWLWTCWSCGGRGRITCPSCGGTGIIRCKKCLGLGEVECVYCKGTTKIIEFEEIEIEFTSTSRGGNWYMPINNENKDVITYLKNCGLESYLKDCIRERQPFVLFKDEKNNVWVDNLFVNIPILEENMNKNSILNEINRKIKCFFDDVFKLGKVFAYKVNFLYLPFTYIALENKRGEIIHGSFIFHTNPIYVKIF
jgi:hypothetical protein